MDGLKKEIKGIKNKLDVLEPVLVKCYANVQEVGRTQECIEHQLSTNEDIKERLASLEKYMDTLHDHLNQTIVRVNAIHCYLKDLECDEKIEDTDDELSEKE